VFFSPLAFDLDDKEHYSAPTHGPFVEGLKTLFEPDLSSSVSTNSQIAIDSTTFSTNTINKQTLISSSTEYGGGTTGVVIWCGNDGGCRVDLSCGTDAHIWTASHVPILVVGRVLDPDLGHVLDRVLDRHVLDHGAPLSSHLANGWDGGCSIGAGNCTPLELSKLGIESWCWE
jgi:hypothetical protein